MHNRHDGTNGTLNRLNRALSALEGRLDAVTHQRGGIPDSPNDLSMIRSRQAALNASPRRHTTGHQPMHPHGIDQGTHHLQDELRQLRSDLEHQMSGVVSSGLEGLRGEMQGLRHKMDTPAQHHGQSPVAGELRADIAALKQDIALLAREDSLREMVDRFSVVEREIVNLPQTLGSRDELISLANRLDSVQNAISSLPQSGNLTELEGQVKNLAVALERMAQFTETATFPAENIDIRLDELSRAVAAIPATVNKAPSVDNEVLNRLEDRIANVAALVQNSGSDSSLASLDAKFSDLTHQIGALHQETAELRGENKSAASDDAILRLTDRIDDLGNELKKREGARAGTDHETMLSELNDRVVYIIQQLNENTSSSQETTQSLMTSIDTRMDEIARRIEENERQSANVPSIENLEGRLDEISQLLTSGSGASDSASTENMGNLEAQIAGLAEMLNSSPAPADEESLMSAARIAAEEAVARLNMSATGQEPLDLRNLTDDLKALEELSRESDDRNTRTFEAIHDTLLKVVDHLSGLEDTIRTNPVPVGGPAPGRMQVDAPSVFPGNGVPIEPQREFREPLSPADAAAAAAAAAVKDRVSQPQEAGVEVQAGLADDQVPEATSLLRGMANKLRRGSKNDRDVMSVAVDPDGLSVDIPQPVSEPELTVSDEPIEPGAGGADLSAIMRRVREERSGTDMDGNKTAGGNSDDDRGKSDFIAAARRAAKAAAAEATVTGSDDKKGSKKNASSLGSMLAAKRRPILVGAGAILLAILALPLVKGMLIPTTPPAQNQAEVLESEPLVENSSTASLPEEDFDLSATAPEENQVRDVMAPSQDPLDDSQSMAIDAGTQMETIKAVEVSIDEVPEAAGPVAMREAAASGDAKAIYLVGDYFFGGVSGQSGNDLGEALKWYEKSANLGYAPAQYRVGNFYEKGFGGTRDLMKAQTWYQLAAEQGNAAAMHNLAVLFANGPDGTPDVASATRWFEKAAELGVKDSQFNLGILSAQGNNGAIDLPTSYKWFSIVAKTGDEDAKAKRDQVAEALSEDQRTSTQKIVDEWEAKEISEDVNIVAIPDEWRTDTTQTASAPELSPAEMKKAVQNIQGILNNNGYDAGPVDGMMGNKTREAIRSFQEKNGLVPTGEVNAELVNKLLEVNESS